MKKISKLFALALALVMALGLTACGGTDEPQETGSAAPESSAPAEGTATYTVGICQQMTRWTLPLRASRMR